MPITTVYDSTDYIRTAKSILAEWLADVGDFDIVFTFPHQLEKSDAELTKPIIWLRQLQARRARAWSGRATGQGKGENKWLNIELFIIAKNTQDQGFDLVDKLSGDIEYYFLENGHLLGAAGVKKAKIGPPVNVTEWQGTNFVGNRHLISAQVLMTVS